MFQRSYLPVLAILFTSFLILSNLTAAKIIHIGNIDITAGIIFFPLTYILDDILTEIYGFQESRRIIWGGLFANIVVVAGLMLAVSLPPSVYFPHQAAFESVFYASPRIALASIAAYVFGEFTNAIILSKLKIRYAGRYFWFRALGSTVIGALLDTTCFTLIAFLGVIPYESVVHIILIEYAIKLTYEIASLPITYKFVSFLKRVENSDVYDYNVKYSLFSFRKPKQV